MDDTTTPFQMSRISIRGGIGAGLLIAVLIGAMLADLPLLRAPTLAAIAGGLIFAAGLIAWRRQQPLDTAERPTELSLRRIQSPKGRRRPAPEAPVAPIPRTR